MSGGGSVPTAPNLSQNTTNANQTFGTATSAAQQTANTAAGYNANSQNTINNVVGQETPMVSAVNNSANQNLQTYGQTFVPLQQQQAQEAQQWGSQENVQNQEGRAAADVNANTQSALANQRQSLASEGVDPASIHGGALDAQTAVQGAAAAAGAANTAGVNTQLQSQQLINQANQVGLAAGAQGTTQAATGASIGNSTAGTQSQVNAQDVNNTTAANSYLNTGIAANNSAVNTQQAGFQDQQTDFQDTAANNASMLSGIGSIAGAAAMFMSEGGAVPHDSQSTMGIPPRFMDPRMAPGLIKSFYERGGPVSGQGALPVSPKPGSTDTKPAMLTPGEFVIPRDAAEWKGHEHWYKKIDKAREEISERKGLPPRPTSALTMRSH
jgi:hypothetical protein